MVLNQLLLIATEGLIFGLFAYGVYLSFIWLRFPDLTPDGSFMIGGCSYVAIALSGYSPLVSLLVSFIAGALCGTVTAVLNRFVRIPPVIAGLLTSVGLYSVGWVILGKPNQFLDNSRTLVGSHIGTEYNLYLLGWVVGVSTCVIVFLHFFSETIWGIRIKAIGENPLLVKSITRHETAYYTFLLALANGVVGLAGALFIQRSFSADINMGLGQTIVGLIGMMIGLLIVTNKAQSYQIFIGIAAGSVLYRGVMFLTLEFGLPAEFFRLASAAIMIALFFLIRARDLNILKDLRWK